MSGSSGTAPPPAEAAGTVITTADQEQSPEGRQGAPLGRPTSWHWGPVVQAAVALVLIGAAILTSIQGLDDRNLRLHHLEHAAFVCGGGLLGLLVSRRLWPPDHRFNLEQHAWVHPVALGMLLIEPLVLMAIMIPFTSPWLDAHPPIHALEHLLLMCLGGVLGVVGSWFSPVLGWFAVLVSVAMMIAFAGIVLPAAAS